MPRLPQPVGPFELRQPDGVTEPYINEYVTRDTTGYWEALVPPGVAITQFDSHRTIYCELSGSDNKPLIVAKPGFIEIEPLVYVNEAAKQSSAVQQSGLLPKAVNEDYKQGRFRTTNPVVCMLPERLPEGPVAAFAAMNTEYYADRRVGEVLAELHRSVLVTDSDIANKERPYPSHLAEIVLLSTVNTQPVDIALVEPSAESRDRRLEPILCEIDGAPAGAIEAGRLVFDKLVLTGEAQLANYREMGVMCQVPESTERESLLAGLKILASGTIRRVREEPATPLHLVSSYEANIQEDTA